MTYELAKQLKDAEFPQEGMSSYFGKNGRYCNQSEEIPDCANPTLSELIEACGDIVFILSHDIKGWHAMSSKNIEISGATPEEAVANLWLVLNLDKKRI